MHDPELMPDRLVRFLEHQGAVDVSVANYTPMTGGYSRLMARFDAKYTLGGETVDTTLVLRGDPPPGQAIIDSDRSIEFDLISSVSDRLPTPAARFLDATGEHCGTPALVIDFTPAASTLPWIEANGIGDLPVRLADLAGAIHTVPVALLPASVPRPSTDDAMGEQIARWKASADAHVEDLPIFRFVGAWLNAHRPPPVPLGLVHHDFSTANMLVGDDGGLIVIDWELATIGDPREDLGYFKAYSQAAPPDLIDADVDAFCTRYRALTGYTEEQLNPSVLTYFIVLGVIGVVDQIRNAGAAMARGEARSSNIAFSMDNILFGHAAWMQVTAVLEAALDGGAS